jgi:two-component system sensor histidine kinase KdpD
MVLPSMSRLWRALNLRRDWPHYVMSTVAIVAATVAGVRVGSGVGDDVAAVLYLLIVINVALRSELPCALFSGILSSAGWYYFFVPPSRSFTLENIDGLIATTTFCSVAVATVQLASNSRRREVEAAQRERHTATLYDLSLAVVNAVDLEQLMHQLADKIVVLCGVTSCSVWRRSDREFVLCGHSGDAAPDVAPPRLDRLTDAPHRRGSIYEIPLRVDNETLGVLQVTFPTIQHESDALVQERLLATAANHAAVALKHEKLSTEAAEARAKLEVDGLKSSLLSSVTHDLRTPLASIKTAAAALWSEDAPADDSSRRTLVQSIVNNADRLNNLVGNLLDMSRLEAGAWQPRRELCPFSEVLGTVLGRFEENEAQRVSVDVSPQLPLVPIDEIQIEQVLWNLFENAFKYSPPASPLALSARVSGGHLLVSLRDHGMGLPAGEEERIFQKFYRAHRGGEGGAPGVGMGLALCKGIVEAHGGRIWATNHAAGGAEFSLTLPLELDTPPCDDKPARHQSGGVAITA